MLMERKELEKYIKDLNRTILFDSEKCLELYDFCNEKYGIKKDKVADVVSQRVKLSDVSTFVLFAMLDGHYFISDGNTSKLNVYFTDAEIKELSKQKSEEEELKFPLTFPMIQIAPDQWIGSIELNTLSALAKAQMIHYDSEIQKTRNCVINGKTKYYKESKDQNYLDILENLLDENRFVPNTITFNIPKENIDTKFSYNKTRKEFSISEMKYLYIADIDSYHKYLALEKYRKDHPDFNITIEIRITNFYNDKLQNYIFQNNQQIKLSKADLSSYDVNNIGNIICMRLNEDPRSNIKGLVGRNDEVFPMQDMSAVISYFYKVGNHNKQVFIIEKTKVIINYFNFITESDPELIKNRHNIKSISAMLYICKKYYETDPSDHIMERLHYLLSKVEEMDGKKFKSRKMKKVIENDYDSIMEGVEF